MLQSAGGYDMFDKSIYLTIGIYCEMTGADEQEFKRKLKDIKQVAWGSYRQEIFNPKAWESH